MRISENIRSRKRVVFGVFRSRNGSLWTADAIDVKRFPRQPDHQKFLVLAENRLAVAAVRRISPSSRRSPVSLVTIVAPSGCGKSHLARQLRKAWEDDSGSGKVHLLTATEFAAQLAEASVQHLIRPFQMKYRRNTKLLICEDLQGIARRPETQQQLQATIDEVVANGGKVLLTATRMPNEIKGLSRKLINRIHGGLCVSMDRPGPTARLSLLKHFFAEIPNRPSAEELRKMAETFDVSPRELSGLAAQWRSQTPEASARLAQEFEARRPSGTVTLAEVTRLTANAFGVSVAELRGPGRSQSVSLARQTAMSIARELLEVKLLEIGEYFHRGNHSTVIHACRKIERQRREDPLLQSRIESILGELRDAR